MLALLALNSAVVRDPAVEKTLNCSFALKSIELLASCCLHLRNA